MADNVNIPATGAGDATPVIAADDISGVKHQRVKVEWGVDGVVNDTSASAPLPVVQTGTPVLPTGASTAAKQPALGTAGASSSDVLSVQGIASGTALPVSAASLPLPSGAATAAGLTTINSTLGTPLQAGGNVVVTGTVPLPSGAATAAKQPALGTAGAASTDVLTIQGIASGVAIPVTGGGTPTDLTATANFTASSQACTITGMNGMSSAYIDVSGTFSATMSIQGTVDGTNWFVLPYFAINNATVVATSTFVIAGDYVAAIGGLAGVRLFCSAYVSGTVVVSMRASAGANAMRQIGVTGSLNANQSVNTAQVAGTATAVNNGVVSNGTQRVTIASDSTGQVQLAAPATTGGYTISRTLAAGSTNATSVKGSAGQVYGWYLANAAAYTVFLKLYNSASAPTAGSGTPVLTIPVPAGGGANVEFMRGIAFSSGIGFTITKLVADADTTVVVANDLVVNLLYA